MNLQTVAENGIFAPRRIAEALRTTNDEIARTAGLGRERRGSGPTGLNAVFGRWSKS